MIRAHLATADIILLALYAAFTLLVGFWRRHRTSEDYMIASRSLGLPVFVATLVATWYGGILAVGEFTYESGIANWTTQGLPYYVFAILFAILLAPRVRQAALYTIPDKLGAEHSRGIALLGALFTFVLSSPAPYILMVGQLTAIVMGWPLLPAMVVGTILSMIYVYVGGFESDVRINVFQFCLMFGGFAVALVCLYHTLGGPHWLAAHVPPSHLTLTGGRDVGFIVVWFFIALWTFVDPGFHQRCYAARTPKTAQTGIIVAVVCWAIFDFMTTTTGLYARAGLPNLPQDQHGLAFPLLAEQYLPAGIRGLFYIAMLATIMSTVVSYTFLSGMTIGRDFLWRIRGGGNADVAPSYVRLGVILATLIGIVISLVIPSVVRQWYALGTVVVPGLLPAVLTAYWPKWKPTAPFVATSMVLGSGTALACLSTGWLRYGIYADTPQFPFGVQPMYPGLLAAAIITLAGIVLRMRHHGGNAASSPNDGDGGTPVAVRESSVYGKK